MSPKASSSHLLSKVWIRLFPLLILAWLVPASTSSASESGPAIRVDPSPPISALAVSDSPTGPTAACSGGPVIDGITLDECYDSTFTVGGVNKTVRVWYTKVQTEATREQDGTTYTLQHWIDTDEQAQQVAAWGREAWERYYSIFEHHPYDTSCDNRINVRLEHGVGWKGLAYWGEPGKCWIGVSSPWIRAGHGQKVVYHEFQHYLQYSYDDGCYTSFKPNYPENAEFLEGYADAGADAVDNVLDATIYGGVEYDPATSMYAKSYYNLFSKYFIEQLGSLYAPADAWYHMDAVRSHYEMCDTQDTLYVLNSLIPSLKTGMTEERFFTNFFAANWAKDWASTPTQPELVYFDDDGNPYGNTAPLTQDETISTSTPRDYSGQTTPDQWAAQYYQVTPLSDCGYVQAKVDGAPAANLGINLMAAKTTAPTSVRRYSWIGEDFSRTFLGYGTHDKIVITVNSFNDNDDYDASFACVIPTLSILEPRHANFAMVGDPDSPIAFLARFQIMDGTNPVLGVPESSITANAGGDPVALVSGSMQLVGEEYWAVMLPPEQPAGTGFVDLEICLNGSICVTETKALKYVNPGNTDQALVFDGSASMSIEDTPEEGTRLENAQKAGYVMADMLRTGDRVLVTSFSGFDDPPGCLSTGDCKLDLQTPQERTDVVNTSIIPTIRAAIDSISARMFTPIGAALRDAKDQLLAEPTNDPINPKHIILLSDGQENVHPLYGSDADLRFELKDSGVVIDTIGLSSQANQALLAQIASDTGGVFRFVPTTGGTLATLNPPQIDSLVQAGLTPSMIDQLNTEMLPGPLGLDDVYEFFDTKNQGATRLFHEDFTFVPAGEEQTITQYVDDSINSLRIVVAGKQEDQDFHPGCTIGYHRKVYVLPPGSDPRGYPVSPPIPGHTPADWDIRNSEFDDVVVIYNPVSGVWGVRTWVDYTATCPAGASEGGSPEAPLANESDFMMNLSAHSNIVLQGRFLEPVVDNQGDAGDVVPIVATLLDRKGAIPSAAVGARIDKPGGYDVIVLRDDGLHNDGAADDGIYGWNYPHTTVGGAYNVRIIASLPEAGTDQFITREWLGSFYINGPDLDDQDADGMPDPWERRCKLNTELDDSLSDMDNDNLTNLAEFLNGTSPCNADTDHGGEKDGSEVSHARNPLWPRDDKIGRLNWHGYMALNNMIVVRWTPPISTTHMLLSVETDPDLPPDGFRVGNTGIYTYTRVTNGITYFLSLAPGNDENPGTSPTEGPYSEPEAVTPKADPDMPSGAVLINNDEPFTRRFEVMLSITSTDTPLEGMAESANAHQVGPLALRYNEISGDIEMRISNDISFPHADWQPLAQSVPWRLSGGPGQIKTVYVQFRDGAGNESLVVWDDIILTPIIYLPILHR